mmetsp:Transcript_27822/g.67849  ORF Transcript_27822/g.67849 Transcript_27822/m.67849 type:complete len:325 (+) Transcript_27822:3549-4523(+)
MGQCKLLARLVGLSAQGRRLGVPLALEARGDFLLVALKPPHGSLHVSLKHSARLLRLALEGGELLRVLLAQVSHFVGAALCEPLKLRAVDFPRALELVQQGVPALLQVSRHLVPHRLHLPLQPAPLPVELGRVLAPQPLRLRLPLRRVPCLTLSHGSCLASVKSALAGKGKPCADDRLEPLEPVGLRELRRRLAATRDDKLPREEVVAEETSVPTVVERLEQRVEAAHAQLLLLCNRCSRCHLGLRSEVLLDLRGGRDAHGEVLAVLLLRCLGRHFEVAYLLGEPPALVLSLLQLAGLEHVLLLGVIQPLDGVVPLHSEPARQH